MDDVQCPCCGLYYPRGVPPRAYPYRRTALDPRSGLCWDCCNHRGDSEPVKVARGKHHGKMLRREYNRLRARLAAARDELVEKERELAMRPVRNRVVIENLDQFIVQTAQKERDEAYRRRDVAMGALSDVRVLHHKRPEDKERCSCGQQYRKCDMAQIADRWEGVEAWERSQAGQAYRGARHYLDHAHPALKDRNYFREVYGA